MLQVRNVVFAIGIISFGILVILLVLYLVVNGEFSTGSGWRAILASSIGGIFVIGGIWRLAILMQFRKLSF